MTQLREKHLGLKTGNKGRFASVTKPEGASIDSVGADHSVTLRYGLDSQTLRELREESDAGCDVLELASRFKLSPPAVADILDSFEREQITADKDVPADLLGALKSAGVSSCHVERMKRGKTNLLIGGLSIRTDVDEQGLLQFHVGDEVISAQSEDDHDAWETALKAAVDHQAVKNNIAPLLAAGKVSFAMNNYKGSCKGRWDLDGHVVKFEVSPQGNVMFEPGMAVEAGHALQKDLGVSNAKQVTPLIGQLRSRISAAHRWALWHPTMDTYRHAARPGLKDAFAYQALRSDVESKLEVARGRMFDTQEGVVLEASAPGYVAQVLISSQREPAYFINDREAFGLDEGKTNQRDLAKFMRAHIEELRTLDVGRRNGLARTKRRTV